MGQHKKKKLKSKSHRHKKEKKTFNKLAVQKVQARPSKHVERARSAAAKAAAKLAWKNNQEDERSRLEAAAQAVALDFDALDNLPWMPRQSNSSGRASYASNDDPAHMDFKSRPPKLGIGAKASNAVVEEDTGLRKVCLPGDVIRVDTVLFVSPLRHCLQVLRREMKKTKRTQRAAALEQEGSSSDSDSDTEEMSRTTVITGRRGLH